VQNAQNCTPCLAVASSLLKGSAPSDLKSMGKEIGILLCDKSVRETFEKQKQLWILKCCEPMVDLIQEDTEAELKSALFVTLISILALAKDNDVQTMGFGKGISWDFTMIR